MQLPLNRDALTILDFSCVLFREPIVPYRKLSDSLQKPLITSKGFLLQALSLPTPFLLHHHVKEHLQNSIFFCLQVQI